MRLVTQVTTAIFIMAPKKANTEPIFIMDPAIVVKSRVGLAVSPKCAEFEDTQEP